MPGLIAFERRAGVLGCRLSSSLERANTSETASATAMPRRAR